MSDPNTLPVSDDRMKDPNYYLGAIKAILYIAEVVGISPAVLVEQLAIEFLPREPKPQINEVEAHAETLPAPGPTPKPRR